MSEDEHMCLRICCAKRRLADVSSCDSAVSFSFVCSKFISTPLSNHSYAKCTSRTEKNYTGNKCSGTLPLSRNSQNIHFIWLIMEQHTGEKNRFSIKQRRNEIFWETHANLTPDFDPFGAFLRKIYCTTNSQCNF